MAGVLNGSWIPFQDQVGRQGWYNQATGQTMYQMYGGYNAAPILGQQQQMQQQQMQVYQPQMQVPQVPQVQQVPQMGYMPQVPQQIQQIPPMPQTPLQGGMAGWQTLYDRTGRRYYYNSVTGQSMYY